MPVRESRPEARELERGQRENGAPLGCRLRELVQEDLRVLVVCMLSVLRFHELTTQAPFEVWLAIPNKARPPRLEYSPLRIVRFSETTLTGGVDEHVSDRAASVLGRLSTKPVPTSRMAA